MTKRFFSLWAVMALVFVTGACATAQQAEEVSPQAEYHDPFEGFNRGVFAFNNAIDDAYIHPIVLGYRAAVPQPARTGVNNVLSNLGSPVIFMNQALQGDVEGAWTVVLRAVINTTIGVGGIFDVAKNGGLEHEFEDFGQTLAVWGVDSGPYLVVPVLGPATLRDYAGFIVDGLADPLRWYLTNTDREGLYYSKVGANYLSVRESLLDTMTDLERSSFDYYAALRSVYFQRRLALINDQHAETAAYADFEEFQ